MQPPITKEELRGLKVKIEEEQRIRKRNQQIDNYAHAIRQGVMQVASTGHTTHDIQQGVMQVASKDPEPKTMYFYNATKYGVQHIVADISGDLIEKLRESFPDCLIEYHETKTMDGRVIESGILVDWT